MPNLSNSVESIDLLALLQKHRWALIVCIGTGLIISLILMQLIPKQFKSKVVMSIQPGYFQNPLAIGMDTHEVMELKNQRELILKRALSNEFIAELGLKYSFSSNKVNRNSGEGYEKIRRKFEIFFLNSMTFQVSFIANSPEVAHQVLQDTSQRVLSYLQESRRNSILSTQKAIQDDLDAMGPIRDRAQDHDSKKLQDEASAELGDPDTYRKELLQIDSKIEFLRSVYATSHPELKQLQNRQRELKSWIHASEATLSETPRKKLTHTNSNIYEDLLRKWHYLNVTLALENQKEHPQILMIEAPALYQTPIWPKYDSISLWCLGGGLGAFLVWVLFAEWLEFRKKPK